jgi:hypothetical protein
MFNEGQKLESSRDGEFYIKIDLRGHPFLFNKIKVLHSRLGSLGLLCVFQ